MFKKLFSILFLINTIASEPFINKSQMTLRQKFIYPLSQDLFIKNIILFKSPLLAINQDAITFVKLLSQSHIYTSFLTMNEIKSMMNDHINCKIVFSKTLIITFNEEFNSEIYKFITQNQMGSSKFLWLVWQSSTNFSPYYISFNVQLFIVEEKVIKNNKIFIISEMYHPSILRPFMFKSHFGLWSENKGLKIPETDLYKRRNDMNGTELLMVIYQVF